MMPETRLMAGEGASPVTPVRPSAIRGWDARTVAEWSFLAMLAFGMLSPLLTGDVSLVSGESQGSGGQGNLLRQGVYVVIFGVALVVADVTRFPERLWSPPASVLAMLAWCGVTVPLAIHPGVSGRRLFLTVMVAQSVFLLVQRAGYDAVVGVVRRVTPVILLANYAAVLALPGFAIHHATTAIDPSIVGAWRGILMQKNFAGLVCAYTIIFFALDGGRIRWAVRGAVVVAAGFFLYQTQSKTSMGFTVASIGVAAVFTRYNPYYRVVALVFALLGVAFVGLAAYLNWEALSAPFHDEMFLTGRVQIWPVLLDFVRDHPLTGSGYGSFWDVPSPQPIEQYVPPLPWKAWILDLTSGHNGYIDLLVQTGWPGMVLAICATILAPLWRFLTSLTLDRSRGGLLLACLLFSICHNLTESTVFDRDSPVQVFLMLTLALLGVETRPRSPGGVMAGPARA
jgi:O-antigen ligase